MKVTSYKRKIKIPSIPEIEPRFLEMFPDTFQVLAAMKEQLEVYEKRGEHDDSVVKFRDLDLSKINKAEYITTESVSGTTIGDVQSYMRYHGSSGLADGGTITDNGNQTFAVAAGYGWIRTIDDHAGKLVAFNWDKSTSNAIADGVLYFVYVKYNNGQPIVALTETRGDINGHDSWELGRVTREGTTLHIENNPDIIVHGVGHIIERFRHQIGMQRSNGLILGETGTRNITVTAGEIYDKLNEFEISAIDTSATGTFDSYTSGGIESSANTQWDNQNYDNAGVLTAMTVGRYGNLWFFIEADGDLICIYGTSNSPTLATAQTEAVPSILPKRLQENGGILIARLTYLKGASTASVIQNPFTTQFQLSSASDHGSLSGLSDDDHTQYILANGTRALTGAWDAGAYEIRALSFYSDVTTGTPPLTIASTTAVTNLNADMLDGQHYSDFSGSLVTNGNSHDHLGGDGAAIEGTSIASTGETGGNKYLREDGDGTCSWQTVAGGASPLTTKGDIYTFSSVDARLPVGTDGYILQADSAETTGLKWVAASGGGNVSNTGTPIDNQIAVWTNSSTIEGTTGLTYDGAILTLKGTNIEYKQIETTTPCYTSLEKLDTHIAQRVNEVDVTSNGYALDFDGDNDYVDIGSITSADALCLNGSTWSCSFWLYLDGAGDTTQRIIDKSDGGAYANGWGVQVGGTSGLLGAGADGSYRVCTVTGVPSTTWTHCVITADGSNWKFYINTVEVTTGTTTGTYTAPPSDTTNCRIGTWNHSTARELNGRLDELAVWSKVLSSDEISDLYNSGNGLYIEPARNFPSAGGLMGTNLAALWHFDENTGTVAYDSSGNSFDGTLTNMAAEDWVAGKIAETKLTETTVWKHESQRVLTINETTGLTKILGTAIGIDQTSPVAKLDILGDTAAQTTVLVKMAGSQTADPLRINDSTDTEIFSIDASGGVACSSIDAGHTTGSVLFQGASSIAEDNTELFWDNTNKRLGIGDNTPACRFCLVNNNSATSAMKIKGAVGQSASIFHVVDSSDNDKFNVSPDGYIAINSDTFTTTVEGTTITNQLKAYSTLTTNYGDFSAIKVGTASTRGARWGTYRANTSTTTLVDGDVVGEFSFFGHDGTDYMFSARLLAQVEGAVSANTVPMGFSFETSTTKASGRTERLRIKPSGTIWIPATNQKLGFAGTTSAISSTLYNDGTDFVINPQENGSANLKIIGADTYWTGDGSGLAYGNMFSTSSSFAVTLTTQNTWYEIDAATTNIAAGQLNLVTFPDDHYLLVQKAGRYKIDWSLTSQIDTASQEVECGIMKNGTIENSGQARVRFNNTGRNLSISGTTILDLAANDQISLGARNITSSGKIITNSFLNVSLMMIGGT